MRDLHAVLLILLSWNWSCAGQEENHFGSSTTQDFEQARSDFYFASIRLTQKLVEDGEIAEAMEVLAACPAELRHWEWGYLQYLCNMDRKTIVAHGGEGVSSISLSADGKLLVSGGGDNAVRLWDVESGHEITSVRVGEPGYWGNQYSTVALHPTGRLVAAIGTQHGFVLIDLKTRDVHQMGNPDDECHSLAFSEDGQTLATIHRAETRLDRKSYAVIPSCTVTLWNTQTRKALREFSFEPRKNEYGSLEFSYGLAINPSGKFLATELALFDIAAGTPVMDLEPSSTAFGHNSVAFDATGEVLATCNSETVNFWRICEINRADEV